MFSCKQIIEEKCTYFVGETKLELLESVDVTLELLLEVARELGTWRY